MRGGHERITRRRRKERVEGLEERKENQKGGHTGMEINHETPAILF